MSITKESIKKTIKEQNVRYLRLQFTDLMGVLKNVEVPASKIDDVLDNKTMFDGSSIDGFVRIQEADMFLYPDLSTWLVLEWESNEFGKVGRFICDIYKPDGTPFTGDPRYILRKQVELMKKEGFETLNIGLEPEFFLFKRDEMGRPSLELSDNGGYFDMSPIDTAEDCRREIVLELEKIGFDMEASHHEVAPGQNEINFRFADALAAADNLQTFKVIVKNIAKRHNLHATFMPKPIANINGNGMHMNCSLSYKDGKNAFYDEKADLQLSAVAHNWIAGLMKHARSFTALTNPTVNSYKRLVPGYEAPCYISWSDANRSVMIRIPATRGAGTRTELRSVDPSSNAYLSIAAILAAGLDGVTNKLACPPATYENLYEMSRSEREKRNIFNLPENLKDSVKELKRSELMKSVLGEHAHAKFIEAKKKEWTEYRTLVTQWEIDKYINQ